jgi:hypothetical protein
MICRASSAIAALALCTLACDGRPPTAADGTTLGDPPGAPGSIADVHLSPVFSPSSFVPTITNPYLPHIPGTLFRLRSRTPDGIEINLIRVTRQTKDILGVEATVVHDQVFLNGDLTEDTFDWEAQDGQGNVWYFGEDSKELEHGIVVSTEGSWQAGVDGAHPGIIMPAHPTTGQSYVQEDAPDVAEDRGKVLSTKATVEVPFGHFTGCVQTMEWSVLEHGDREHKFYCPGTGLVEEVQPKGGRITNELLAIRHF